MKTAYDKIYDIMNACYDYNHIPHLGNFTNHPLLKNYKPATIEKQYYRARADIRRREIVDGVKESQEEDKFYDKMLTLAFIFIVCIILIAIL